LLGAVVEEVVITLVQVVVVVRQTEQCLSHLLLLLQLLLGVVAILALQTQALARRQLGVVVFVEILVLVVMAAGTLVFS
jgi:hypothetical protein